MDRLSLVLVILGAINWGLIAIFNFDVIGYVFGGQSAIMSRVIYGLIALAGLWCVSLLFRDRDVVRD